MLEAQEKNWDVRRRFNCLPNFFRPAYQKFSARLITWTSRQKADKHSAAALKKCVAQFTGQTIKYPLACSEFLFLCSAGVFCGPHPSAFKLGRGVPALFFNETDRVINDSQPARRCANIWEHQRQIFSILNGRKEGSRRWRGADPAVLIYHSANDRFLTLFLRRPSPVFIPTGEFLFARQALARLPKAINNNWEYYALVPRREILHKCPVMFLCLDFPKRN